jgi:hypothetical protein
VLKTSAATVSRWPLFSAVPCSSFSSWVGSITVSFRESGSRANLPAGLFQANLLPTEKVQIIFFELGRFTSVIFLLGKF